MSFVDVIIPLAVEGFFTYAVPVLLESKIKIGLPVVVPFAGNKKYTAWVYRIHHQPPAGYRIREVENTGDEELCLTAEHLRFLCWISEYYMATPGEVLRAALPVSFRLESFTCLSACEREVDYTVLSAQERAVMNFLRPGEYVALKEIEKFLQVKSGVAVVKSLLNKGYVQIKENIDEVFREKTEKTIKWARSYTEEALSELLDTLKRAPVQYKMLCRWIEFGKESIPKQEFAKESVFSGAALKALCDKNILTVGEVKVSRLKLAEPVHPEACHALTDLQQIALEQIQAGFRKKECVLLQGVTSSGKTELYIHLIKECIDSGKQVLYMLPEIALTIQIIKRLRRVFGDRIGIYHSGMPDSMRAELWKKQCGERPYAVILGVRSSIFLPFRNLGLIVVDEEHDASYKQKEPAPRYYARDVAIMLGKFWKARVLLGSATPSFESFRHAGTGKYGYVSLDNRYGNIQMPELQLADIAEFRRKKQMKGSFTPVLYEEMKRVLEQGKQVILFQNRRGYSTYLQCDKCGAIVKCRHCDVSMTYYKQRNVLSCRYCGSLEPVRESCPDCGQGHYRLQTPGTERIEEEVAGLFPSARVARMDLDVMSSKSRYQSVIDDFEKGRTDILIGTQMVTKGLDFENVKLVGVMNADTMISFPDFRAEERAYCMLMQVSGRSGRKGERGKVIVQTGEIKNRIFSFLQAGSYRTFYAALAQEREFFGYPPFSRLIRIELRHKEPVVLRNAANRLAGRLREKLLQRVCGPAVPEVGRIAGLYRVHLLIKLEQGPSLSGIKTFLKREFAGIQAEKTYGALRIFCDVDPV